MTFRTEIGYTYLEDDEVVKLNLAFPNLLSFGGEILVNVLHDYFCGFTR